MVVDRTGGVIRNVLFKRWRRTGSLHVTCCLLWTVKGPPQKSDCLRGFPLKICRSTFNANFLVVTDLPKSFEERPIVVFLPLQRKNAPLGVGNMDVPNVILSFKNN